MTAADSPATAYAWLASSAMRKASDALLGCILLILGAFAVWDSWGTSYSRLGDIDTGFFPTLIGTLTIVVGALLLVRSAFVQREQPAPWRLLGVVLVAAGIVIVYPGWHTENRWLLFFGPPEYVGLILLMLVTATALARWSWLRATGMMLVGLLLSTVGLDVITGQVRLTMGFEQLLDGIAVYFAALGLLVLADGLLCLVSPPLWLATFAWMQVPWRGAKLPMAVSAAARASAAFAIAAACYFAYTFEAQAWDIGLVIVFGLFGIAAKLFGWNRLVLILALLYGTVFESSIRQSMLISQGDPAVFFHSGSSTTLLAASVALVALIVFLAVRRARTAPFPAAR